MRQGKVAAFLIVSAICSFISLSVSYSITLLQLRMTMMQGCKQILTAKCCMVINVMCALCTCCSALYTVDLVYLVIGTKKSKKTDIFTVFT